MVTRAFIQKNELSGIHFVSNFVVKVYNFELIVPMKKILILFLVAATFVGLTSMARLELPSTEESVQWLTFEQALKKSKTEKRPIFIDVYTDWCGWCKVMDKNTFNEPEVAKLLNTKFYAVKFNAEQKDDIVFNGTTFKFVVSGQNGYHQLAAALLNNQLSYPTVVFLNENFEMLQPLAGYRKAPEFHKVAQFIGEGHYKNVKWEQWESQYSSPY